MKPRRSIATVIAAAAVAVGAVTATSVQPASAAPACTSQPVANNEDAAGWMQTGRGYERVPLRKAPYGHCGVVTWIDSVSTRMWLWCTAENSYENQWVWVRIDGTQTYGWIWNEHLSAGHQPTRNNGWCPGEPNDGDNGRHPSP